MESLLVRPQPGGLDWPCSQAAFDRRQGAAWRDFKTGQPIFAMAARCGRNGCHPIRASARHKAALARAYHEPPANQSRCRRAGQQDRTYCLGHDGARGAVQGTEITAGSDLADRKQKASTNWRGHDDVMQIRSFRGSGEPARVIALSNARDGLGPDPRRALGPAAIRAASTGRTRDRTRPMLQKRQKVLARAPSAAAVPAALSVCYRYSAKVLVISPRRLRGGSPCLTGSDVSFIAQLGSAAAWPFAARRSRIPVIGFFERQVTGRGGAPRIRLSRRS